MSEFVGQEALASMARSAWMSWLVIATIAVSLSILGGVWLFVQDLRNISQQIGGAVPIVVFLSDDADPRNVEAAIQELPNIKGTTLIPKEQAWEEMQQDLKSRMSFNELLNANPLPNTLRVQTLNPDETAPTAERIKKMQGIEEVNYGGELLAKINEFSATIRTGGLTVSSLLALASLAVIMNTIRLAVMARRREIEIMHLVGASNSFIAWPFLLEGMLFGLFGAALTGIVLLAWRHFTMGKWQELFPFLPMTADYMAMVSVLGGLAVIGMTLGAVGSALSVRKHIRLAMAE
ncbi:MAG: permease-like cell division protein FtsX [Candidatus Sericytochromatia bacterium]